MSELSCECRMEALKAGFASIVPQQLLSIMTYEDLALRACGLPQIDLDFLKVRTYL